MLWLSHESRCVSVFFDVPGGAGFRECRLGGPSAWQAGTTENAGLSDLSEFVKNIQLNL